jgi:protein transport protein SEC24
MTGGQITLFLSQLPTVGPGKLTARDDPTTYNTDKERALFSTSDPFWRTTAEELAECGIGANLFLFPEQYTDVASVGTISAVTGGETFFHPKFQPVRDRDTLHDEIKRTITRETVYNATVRIRCSNGLRAAEHVGGFYQRSLTDLEFGTIDDAKAFAAVLKHEGQRLDDRLPAYVQVAVLYTSSDGHRRVRCLNLSFGTTSLIGNVFRFADLDAAATLLIKEAVSQMPSKSLRDIRQNLQDKTNRMLLMYRKHCAPAVQQGQVGYSDDATPLTPAHPAGRAQAAPAVHPVHAQVEAAQR